MATDWMATLKEAGILAQKTEADVGRLLASETLSVEHAVRLLAAVNELSEEFDEVLAEIEADEGVDEELLAAAFSIESLWSDLTLACLNKVRILRGLPAIELDGKEEDGGEA